MALNMSNLSAIEEYFADAALWTVLSFKGNMSAFEDGDSVPSVVKQCLKYVESFAYVRGSSLGVHVNGEAKVPHWHLAVIVKTEGLPKTLFSNASKHRADYKRKAGVELDVTVRVQPMRADDVRSNIFAYPLKEGLNFIDGAEYFALNCEFSQPLYDAVMQLGKDLYENSCVAQERRRKSERKTRTMADAIFECIGDRKFGCLEDVNHFVMDNYYLKLPRDQPLVHWWNVKKVIIDVCVNLQHNMPWARNL